MRRAVIISAALHVLLLAFVIFGLPQLFRVKPPEQQMIAVEMVTPDQSQTAPKPQPKPEPPKAETAPPAPPPLPEPKPQRVETPPPPPPPPPVPEPKPRVVEAPPPPPPAPPQPATPAPKPTPEVAAVTPEKMPAPAPTPKPKPTPPQAEAKPAPPAPAPAPKAKPQTQQDDFQALLKNLEKQKQQTEQTESREPPQRQPAQPQSQPQAQLAPQRQQASSIDQRRAAAGLVQMVKDQVTPCWNIPAGAKDARDLQIVVVIDLNPDGTLRGSPTVSDASRYESDPFFRAAADSALRALRNPRCTPLKLPYEMYETWKRIEFTFDPKEVIG